MYSNIVFTKNIKNNVMASNMSIREGLKQLNDLEIKVIFVIKVNKFLGTVSEGDIRRALVRGIDVDADLNEIVNKKCLLATQNHPNKLLEEKMRILLVNAVPYVNNGKLMGMFYIKKNLEKIQNTSALIVAGGKGTRLRPITEFVPKPLIKVDGESIIEILIRKLVDSGISDIYISTNYRAAEFKSQLNYASLIGAQIKFIYERKPLGTAGSISKVPFSKSQNLIVLNADLMLSVNFNYLVDEHMNSGSDLTLVSTQHKIKVDYGVIAHEVKSKRVLNFLEKPSWIVDVYSGICIMNSKVTKLVPKNSVMDIPKLVSAAIKKKLQIRQLDLNGYWLDIGTHENIKEINTKLKSEISH